jgi:hypothetical protein
VDGEALEKWHEIAAKLQTDGLLRPGDVDMLAMYCIVVFDPFGGSGTTLIAGHRLKRRVRIIEKDPRYVAVILERWAKMTGQQPILHGVA